MQTGLLETYGASDGNTLGKMTKLERRFQHRPLEAARPAGAGDANVPSVTEGDAMSKRAAYGYARYHDAPRTAVALLLGGWKHRTSPLFSFFF